MMRVRERKYLLAMGGVLSGLAAWIALSGPMLVHARLGPLRGDPRFAVWNPVRDRDPERYGAEYLRRIQSVTCQQGVAGLEISTQEKSTACNKQSREPVTSACRLIERSDKGPGVWLLYQCPYEQHPEDWAETGLTLKRRGGAWVLSSYERIY